MQEYCRSFFGRLACLLVLNSLLVQAFLLTRADPRSHFPARTSAATSCLTASSSNEHHAEEEVFVEGLSLSAETVERWNDIHRLLEELKREIPALLSAPLSEEAAERTYTEDVRLVVGKKQRELSLSRDELIRLNQALVLASAATVQAATFLKPNRTSTKAPAAPVVQCKLGLDANLTSITVHWNVEDPPTYGESLLKIDPETRKINSHCLLRVQFNGQEQDASTIGEFLSSSRQAVKGFQNSPLFQPLRSFTPIFDQVRDEWMAQQMSKQASTGYPSPPVFVIKTNETKSELGNKTKTDGTSLWVPVDEYKYASASENNVSYPFPGSAEWPAYVSNHRAITSFARDIVPALSGYRADGDLHDFFAPNARLYATDGSLLLKGADRLARFYQSLTTMRERSFGSTWTCDRALVADMSLPCVKLEYTTKSPIPGGASPLQFRGTDLYTLAVSENDTPLIQEVRQTKLAAGTNTPQTDSVLLMRSLATAIETGQFQSPVEYSSFLMDLLQLSPKQVKRMDSVRPTATLPRRSDAAALVAYRIMESLHQDIRNLFDESFSTETTQPPPASQFLSEKVTLSGYLEETLLRGRVAYNRNIGFALSTLHTGVQSGRILSEKEPSVRVELTASGNIRSTVKVYLKLKAPMPGLVGNAELQSAGFPLQLGLVSEYVLSPETGKIQRHRLLESRINGQLTPGDVVSRWILRGPSGRTESEDDDMSDDVLRTIRDTISWVRSLRSD